MCSGEGDWTLLQPGFPIRTSSDHSSFASSSRLFAGYDVLLRLLVPRHPPCALNNLTTKIYWMLASTVQFSRYGQQHPSRSPRAPALDEVGSRSTQGAAHLCVAPRRSAAADRRRTRELNTPRARTFRTQQRAGRRRPLLTFHPVETGVLVSSSTERPLNDVPPMSNLGETNAHLKASGRISREIN